VKTILFDMDGVLVDLIPTWLHVYGLETGEFVHPDRIDSYALQKHVSDYAKLVTLLPQALLEAPPMIDSSEFNDLVLHNDKFDVYIVTHAFENRQYSIPNIKIDWMRHYFPNFDVNNMIFTSQKHLINGDVLVEDSEKVLEKWEANNPEGEGFLVHAPYNPNGQSLWSIIRIIMGMQS